MLDRPRASELRQRIARLAVELAALREEMLRPRRMISASLIERHLGRREEKRASSAFYLSSAIEGRTRLTYVPRRMLERVRAEVGAWQGYRAALRRWGERSGEMARLLRELGEAQASCPGEEER